MDWKLEVVIVPVSDSEALGFVVDHDTKIGESFRMVQLTPPGSGCSIVIGTQNNGMPAGSIKGLQLVVPDIQQARAQLMNHGVDVSAIKHYEGVDLVDGAGGDWNVFIFFSDPDGNAWAIQERPASKG